MSSSKYVCIRWVKRTQCTPHRRFDVLLESLSVFVTCLLNSLDLTVRTHCRYVNGNVCERVWSTCTTRFSSRTRTHHKINSRWRHTLAEVLKKNEIEMIFCGCFVFLSWLRMKASENFKFYFISVFFLLIRVVVHSKTWFAGSISN